MTTQMSETSTTLEARRTLAPAIVARSEEIERGRRAPPDLVEELTTAGCFRMLVPRSHGGAELDVPSEMRVIEELARADGSVGWTVMIGGLAPVRTPAGDMVARRIHLCEVRDGRISAVTTYCNGGWDAALRARHAAEAPMIRA